MTIIIAHRGASGYLPEHTLPAKALALAMGADYLEQDVVASRDGELVVLHDIHLDRVTDVATRHPQRARADGRYYVRDFDLEELRALNVTERMNPDGVAVYPGRFPVREGRFRVHTLAEEVEFIQGLSAAAGQPVGIYPEIKRPAWHRAEGVDITPLLLDVLARYGYQGRNHTVYLQCFDAAELVRVRVEFKSSLKLVQLIGDNSWGEAETDYEELQTAAGIERIAETADAIGPWLRQLYVYDPATRRPVSTGVTERAHAAGLEVHPYTFRYDELPEGFGSFAALVEFFVAGLRVDGVFTDFPDKVIRLCAACRTREGSGAEHRNN